MSNTIPEIPPQLAELLSQPDRSRVLIDDTHALLTRADFNLLPEYEIPFVVYPGKMWKRFDGRFDSASLPLGNQRWLFCWFGFGIDKGRCSINFRHVLIADESEGCL